MKKLYRFISLILCFCTIVTVFALPASAANDPRYELNFDVNAKAYLLVSLDTGEVVFEKNSDETYTPASLTKLMTAYVVMKYVEDLDRETATAPNYIYDELFGMNSSTADIRQGETLTIRQLLYALMVPSANEAASILADYVGKGDIGSFIMIMNTEAQKLGCKNTHFSNPHGLFREDNYSTAYDMYLIAKACMEMPGFSDIVNTTVYYMPANKKHRESYPILSTVKMQMPSSPYYRSYVHGIKTGSLDEVGHNFVSLCQNNGENYICVVIGADTSRDGRAAFPATARIMDYFFENYSLRNANTSGYPVTEVAVKYSSDTDKALLYADTPVMAILPNDADESSFLKEYHLPDRVSAPLSRGDVVGTVDYKLGGRIIGTSQLVVHDDISRSTVMFIVGKIQEFRTSLYFKVVLILTAGLVILYCIYAYISNKKRDKIQKVKRNR